ncbi:MAG: hypothetical protein WA109_06035 [Bellilinea sp.]
MKINPTELPDYLQSISYKEHGDYFEREYGHFLSDCFPSCEQFWRIFVVPFTKRMDGYPTSVAQGLDIRAYIDPKIEDLAGANYSMFLNLVFAHLHLENKTPSSFEDIYTHLGSVCDLAEMVIEKWHFLDLNLQGKKTKVLQGLSRDEFLKKASELYDEKYPNWYQYYLQKGKSPPINLISRSDILVEYLGRESQSRKDYAAHSQAIRQMRNVIVHDMKVARIIEIDGLMLIPKPTVISEYRSWQKVAAAANLQDKLKIDFAEQYTQAKEDIESLESKLNKIWELLINDILSEFYSTERPSLRGMFNIEFTAESPVILGIKSDTHNDAPLPKPSGVYTGGTAIVDNSQNNLENYRKRAT